MKLGAFFRRVLVGLAFCALFALSWWFDPIARWQLLQDKTAQWVSGATRLERTVHSSKLMRSAAYHGFVSINLDDDAIVIKRDPLTREQAQNAGEDTDSIAELLRLQMVASTGDEGVDVATTVYSREATKLHLFAAYGMGPVIRKHIDTLNKRKYRVSFRYGNRAFANCEKHCSEVSCAPNFLHLKEKIVSSDPSGTGEFVVEGSALGIDPALMEVLESTSVHVSDSLQAPEPDEISGLYYFGPVKMTDWRTQIVSEHSSKRKELVLKYQAIGNEASREVQFDQTWVLDVIGGHKFSITRGSRVSSLKLFCKNAANKQRKFVECDASHTAADRYGVRYIVEHADPTKPFEVKFDPRSARMLPELDPASSVNFNHKVSRHFHVFCAPSLKQCVPVWPTSSRLRPVAKLLPRDAANEDDTASAARNSPSRPVQNTVCRPEPNRVPIKETPLPSNYFGETLNELKSPFFVLNKKGSIAPSRRAMELGLLPIIGGGSYLPNSVAAYFDAVARRDRGFVPQLTLREELQDTVTEQMKSVLQRKVFESDTSALVPRYEKYRKGGFVLMDLRPGQEGKIRAISSEPSMKSIPSRWDYLNAYETHSRPNPVAPLVWARTDQIFTPGSTFKLVTALAAINAIAEGHPNADAIKKALIGGDEGFLRATLNLDIDADRFEYNPKIPSGFIQDNNDKTPGPGLRGVNVESCNEGRADDLASETANLGLCGALVRSSNMWFASLLTFMEAEAMQEGSVSGPYSIARVLDRLQLLERYPLSYSGAALGPDTDRFFGPIADGIVLRPELLKPRTDELASESEFLQRLTFSAFGQAVQSSPVNMASVAAAISLNRPVVPYISHISERPRQNELFPSDDEQALLQVLRNSMRMTVKSGTASGVFNRGQFEAIKGVFDVYGKTGTAEIDEKSDGLNASVLGAWFVGYVTDKDTQQPLFSFACGITHSVESARSCQSLTASVLTELATQPGTWK